MSGYKGTAKGLKSWPCLGEKYSKIPILCWTTHSILRPCLGQGTKYTLPCFTWTIQKAIKLGASAADSSRQIASLADSLFSARAWDLKKVSLLAGLTCTDHVTTSCLGQVQTLFRTEASKIVFPIQDSEAEKAISCPAAHPLIGQIREYSPQAFRQVCHGCSYHILRSSVIYYWTDTQQHGIYLFYIIYRNVRNKMLMMLFMRLCFKIWEYSTDLLYKTVFSTIVSRCSKVVSQAVATVLIIFGAQWFKK